MKDFERYLISKNIVPNKSFTYSSEKTGITDMGFSGKYLVIKNSVNLMSYDTKGLTSCPECDLLLQEVIGESGQRSRCPRCGSTLFNTKENSVERTLALSLAGLILFVPAVLLPIMTLNSLGLEDTGNILEGITDLFRSGFHLVAILVLLTCVVFPLAKIAFLFCISLFLRLNLRSRYLPLGLRIYQLMDEWAMLEIYMLGILVSIIKLKDLAQISYGIRLFCFVALLLTALLSTVTLNEHQYWSFIGQNRDR